MISPMNQRLLAEIGRTQRLEILNSLKRTKGMSVNELVEKMGMSYMGIKQHCLTLQRDGYLDTWRRPQKMGRPEMVYRLTRRSHDLFPADSNEFTLELLRSICDIYGANAPEKLLYNVFEKRTAALKVKAKGENAVERAKWLTECATVKVTWRSFFLRKKTVRKFWNVIPRFLICSRNTQSLAGSSRTCLRAFSERASGARKRAQADSTSAHFISPPDPLSILRGAISSFASD